MAAPCTSKKSTLVPGCSRDNMTSQLFWLLSDILIGFNWLDWPSLLCLATAVQLQYNLPACYLLLAAVSTSNGVTGSKNRLEPPALFSFCKPH